MRTFSQGRAARVIAQGLAVAFLWSGVLMALGGMPASAQVPSGYAGPAVAARPGASQSVAVVPFENLSGYRPETFGQEAADAVATELRDRLLLDILPKADVDIWMRDLGYRPPLTDADLQRLATELEVVLVVTGQARSVKVSQGPEGRSAEVEIAVRLYDRQAEATVNGALVKTKGPASTEANDEALVTKALQQAAFDAVQEMRTRPTVTAKVLWAKDNLVFLNVGGRAGVSNGMKMVAIRNGQRIGMVQVTEASPIGSYANIIQGPPLRTGDTLRGVYELPIGVAAPSPARVERTHKRWTTLVLATAALMGIADLGSTARTLAEGNVAAPAFTASNLANGQSVLPQPATVAGPMFIPLLNVTQPAVVITWIPYSGTEKTRIWGYEIWRNQELCDVIPVADHGENVAFDLPRPPWVQRTVAGTVSTLVTPQGPQPLVTVDTDLRELVTSQPSAATIDFTDTSVSYTFEQTGPIAGQTYIYRVRPIVIQQVQDTNGAFVWVFQRGAELSSPTNRLTAVPAPIAQSVDVSGTIATFFFYSPTGADEAIIEIAKDGVTGGVANSTFPPAATFKKTIPAPSGGFRVDNVQVDLTQLASLPGDSTILWWRIGARNRSDSTAPRPWPLNLSNDYGYVWSFPTQRLLLFSGVSRASLVHQQRALVGRAGTDARRLRRPGDLRGDRVLKAE
jgi:hypothetical protein